jgi:hypothetical protein
MYFKKLENLKSSINELSETNTSLHKLVQEFNENEAAAYIKNKLNVNVQKEKKLRSQLAVFDSLYDTYILHIIKLIEDEKKLIVMNLKRLEQHPDILKYLIQNIKKKEQTFKTTLNRV